MDTKEKKKMRTMMMDATETLRHDIDDEQLWPLDEVEEVPFEMRRLDTSLTVIESPFPEIKRVPIEQQWTNVETMLGPLSTFDFVRHRVIVAGGAPAGAVTDRPLHDVDIFLVGHSNAEERDATVDAIGAHIFATLKKRTPPVEDLYMCTTEGCRTFVSVTLDWECQVVMRRYAHTKEVLGGFDAGSCSVALVGRTPTHRGTLVVSRLGRFAYRWNTNLVDIRRRRTTFESRLLKYHARSWHMALPESESCRDRIVPDMKKLELKHMTLHVSYVAANRCRTHLLCCSSLYGELVCCTSPERCKVPITEKLLSVTYRDVGIQRRVRDQRQRMSHKRRLELRREQEKEEEEKKRRRGACCRDHVSTTFVSRFTYSRFFQSSVTVCNGEYRLLQTQVGSSIR